MFNSRKNTAKNLQNILKTGTDMNASSKKQQFKILSIQSGSNLCCRSV